MTSKEYGAAGVGCTSRFNVCIDEELEAPDHIQLCIDGRTWSFRFTLTSRNEAVQILSFLREHTGRLAFAERVIGAFHGASVRLIKDDEFADRFWIRAFADGGDDGMVDFVLVAEDLVDFTEAMAQAVQDLQS